jgi:hypothetical protein
MRSWLRALKGRQVRKDSSFSEEKEAKRLLFMRSVGLGRSMVTWVATSAGSASPAAIIKSLFASFSSEKEESFLVLF